VQPDPEPRRHFGRPLIVVLVFVVVLALAVTGMLVLGLRAHPIIGAPLGGDVVDVSPTKAAGTSSGSRRGGRIPARCSSPQSPRPR
jgi:hypothetical protein